MRHLVLLKSFMLIAIAFILGASVGNAMEFNPIISGSTAVVGFAISFRPTGVLSDGLDLTNVLADVTNYFKYYNQKIWVQIQKDLMFEKYMKSMPNQKGTYVATSSSRTSFLQAYQHQFTPAGGVALTPYSTPVRRIKMDVLLDNLDTLFGTYLHEMMVDETKTIDNYPFVTWLMNNHIIPGIQEEIELLSIKGEYVAPTPGTAGNSDESADGIFTIIANEIAATNLTNIITTGAINATNVVDKLEAYHKDLPAEYKKLAGPIFVAEDILVMYKYTFRDDKGLLLNVEQPTVRLWGTNKELVGLPDLNGSQRILFTPTGTNGNIVKLFDKLLMPTPQFQIVDRDLKILGDFTRSWGFDTLDAVFVNDQA